VRAGCVLAAALVGVAAVAQRPPAGGAAHDLRLGVLQPVGTDLAADRRAGITRATLAASWAELQPAPGPLNRAAVTALRAGSAQLSEQGFAVSLDLGLQYPPPWVFGLDPATRFVDQNGNVYHAGTGSDVPDAVFDPLVRRAQADYLRLLATALGSERLADVRAGGLVRGELSYPPTGTAGHWWAFDAHARASAPLPGWRPGAVSSAQAGRILDWWDSALLGYARWQLGVVRAAFGTPVEVLLPSWGMRPGWAGSAERRGLAGGSDTVEAGLDWAAQVTALEASGATFVVTWLDAPASGTSPDTEPPVAYLAGLTARASGGLAGENTGGGGPAAVALSVARARAYRLRWVDWMDDAALQADHGRLRALLGQRASDR
jgi:hypothetical protein